MDLLNAVKMLNSMDLLLTYIIVMEGGNLIVWRIEIKAEMHRIQKGLKFLVSDLNSRYRNKNKKLAP